MNNKIITVEMYISHTNVGMNSPSESSHHAPYTEPYAPLHHQKMHTNHTGHSTPRQILRNILQYLHKYHEVAPGSLITPRKSSFMVPIQNCKNKPKYLSLKEVVIKSKRNSTSISNQERNHP